MDNPEKLATLGTQDTGQTKQKTHQFVLLAILLSVLDLWLLIPIWYV